MILISKKIIKTFVLTLLALIAFAANSILCRLALAENNIDAISFTVIRLLSGVIMLLLILRLTTKNKSTTTNGSWMSALMLFLYAICFSFAYTALDTGTGALVLFATVQLTIVIMSVVSGTKLHFTEWLGLIIAFTGFIYLISPNIDTPSVLGFSLMSTAGIAWAIYTLRGRGVADPITETAFNFIRTIPFLLLVSLVILLLGYELRLNKSGIILAILSGAIASGIGYSIWYSALRGLSATEAAIVQLMVPVLAAIGGLIFVSEILTSRLLYSSLLILGGIVVLVFGRFYYVESKIKIP